MTRPIFWPSDGAYVLDFEGHPRANAPVRIWSAQVAGTQVTDLQRVDASGTPTGAVSGGVLFSDANGLIPAFAGPDGGATTLWGDHGYAGARLALSADPVASSGGGAVSSVAGRTGAVVLAESDVTGLTGDLAAKAPLASPALTGVPTVPTAAQDTSTTQAASTAFVVGQASSAAPAMDGSAAVGTSVRHARADHVHPSDTSRLASGAAAGGDLSGTLPSPTVARVNGVAVSGTPSSGQVITATSGSAATWSTPSAGAGDATTSAKGVVQLAGDLAGTAAAPTVARVNGVSVTGTPTAGQVPTATSGSAASWQTPASAPVSSVAGRTGAVTLAESDVAGLTSDLSTLTTGISSKADASATTSALAGKAATSTTITAGTGLTGGGDLSANRTLTVAYGTTSTTATAGNDTRVVKAVQSDTITAIVQLTQAAYDAIGSPSSTTLYVVVG